MYGLFTVHLSTSVRRTPSVALYGSFDYLWAILGGFALFALSLGQIRGIVQYLAMLSMMRPAGHAVV